MENNDWQTKLTDQQFWNELLLNIFDWFRNTLASFDTLVELGVIAAAALLAWPLSGYLRRQFNKLSQSQARFAILLRLWQALERLAFPIVWLVIQVAAVWVMSSLGLRSAAITVVSSLLSAWIVISIVTVFVKNPLGSRIIAVFAWVVAALNILGLLDRTVVILDKASFSLGQVDVSLLTLIKGACALGLLWWLTALIGQLIEARIKASPNLTPSIQVLSVKLLRIGLGIVAFVFALSAVGIELTAFAVFGGAIGVGLGFGLQKIFANLVSGFILLVDKSIKPGDVIAVDMDYGRVESLGARYVSVLTRDGIEHLIPNEELITTRVENWSHSNSLLRLHLMVGVHYNCDVRLAMSLCFDAMAEVPRILKEPAPNCLLREFGDSSVNIEMRFWVSDPMNGRANVSSDLLLIVWDKFHQNDIEIPYPQRDLHVRSSSLQNGWVANSADSDATAADKEPSAHKEPRES